MGHVGVFALMIPGNGVSILGSRLLSEYIVRSIVFGDFFEHCRTQ